MDITLKTISLDEHERLQNMARFFVYDISKSAGTLPNWEVPHDGLFQCFDLKNYITDADRYAYYIMADDEIAGFALINKVGATPDIDWTIAEFFILGKFQGRGIGAKALPLIFKILPGVWKIAVMAFNKPAFAFWSKTLQKLADQNIIQKDFTMTPTGTLESESHQKNIFKVTVDSKASFESPRQAS